MEIGKSLAEFLRGHKSSWNDMYITSAPCKEARVYLQINFINKGITHTELKLSCAPKFDSTSVAEGWTIGSIFDVVLDEAAAKVDIGAPLRGSIFWNSGRLHRDYRGGEDMTVRDAIKSLEERHGARASLDFADFAAPRIYLPGKIIKQPAYATGAGGGGATVVRFLHGGLAAEHSVGMTRSLGGKADRMGYTRKGQRAQTFVGVCGSEKSRRRAGVVDWVKDMQVVAARRSCAMQS